MLELARESDWEAVNRLSIQIHELHTAWRPDIFCQCEAPYPYDTFLEDIQKRMVYVAKLQGIPVGFVVLMIRQKDGPGVVEKKQLVLSSICVDEGLRGQGIGKQMVADVRALAKAFGCQELLLSVHPENDSAVGFYQKCGFRIRSIMMDGKV